MVSAATLIAKMAFGVDDSGIRTAAARVPVIMDYNFYAGNSAQGNAVLTKLALVLLQVSDDNVASAIAGQGDSYWGNVSVDSLKVQQRETSDPMRLQCRRQMRIP